MKTPHLSAKFAVLKPKRVTYVICADPMRKYLLGGGGVVVEAEASIYPLKLP